MHPTNENKIFQNKLCLESEKKHSAHNSKENNSTFQFLDIKPDFNYLVRLNDIILFYSFRNTFGFTLIKIMVM